MIPSETCPVCSKEFTPKVKGSYRQRFCSNACVNVWNTKEFPPQTCLTCGKEFVDRKRHGRKYCSHQCAIVSQTKKERRTCPGCGIEFDQHATKQKYCTPECGSKNREHVGRDETKWAMFTCKWCGKVFEGRVYRNPGYCSRQCISEYGARQPKTRRVPTEYVDKTCIICGKAYKIPKSYDAIRASYCCSRKCTFARLSQIKRGVGNPMYRGGKITYRGPNWGRQSRAAFRRDGFKCQVCGKKLNRIKWDHAIHHIKPFRTFNGDYEAANQLTNLITVCRRCHGKVESGNVACPMPLF